MGKFDYVKTDLHSTMGQERLNDLILLHVHKDTVMNVIDRFSSKSPCRMLLQDPLNQPNDDY
jgi:hypothetical protein